MLKSFWPVVVRVADAGCFLVLIMLIGLHHAYSNCPDEHSVLIGHCLIFSQRCWGQLHCYGGSYPSTALLQWSPTALRAATHGCITEVSGALTIRFLSIDGLLVS